MKKLIFCRGGKGGEFIRKEGRRRKGFHAENQGADIVPQHSWVFTGVSGTESGGRVWRAWGEAGRAPAKGWCPAALCQAILNPKVKGKFIHSDPLFKSVIFYSSWNVCINFPFIKYCINFFLSRLLNLLASTQLDQTEVKLSQPPWPCCLFFRSQPASLCCPLGRRRQGSWFQPHVIRASGEEVTPKETTCF